MNFPTPYEPVFGVLQKVKDHGTYFTACCPAHDDEHPSLSLKVSEGKLLVKCHARQACSWQAIFAAFDSLGIQATAFFADGGKMARKPKIVESHIYRNADGTPRFRTHRWEPGLQGGSKSFTAERFTGAAWAKGMEETEPCLLNLPELAKEPGRAVWLPEGERKAKAIGKLGLLATSAPFGAKAAWDPGYTEALRGRPVVILPDNDEPGLARAREIGGFISNAASEVKILELPGLKAKGDVFDWLVARRWRGCRDELLRMAEEAPTWATWEARRVLHGLSDPVLAAIIKELAA